MLDLQAYALSTIFVGGVAAFLAAIEIGHWLGMRVDDRGDDHVPTLEGAIVGLLALMVAFTFGMALTRFEGRRAAVLSEANAISTTALRARMLPEPHHKEVLGLLRDYVQIRIDLTSRPATHAEWAAKIDKSNAIQEKLWRQAMAIAGINTSVVPTGLFIQALNGMIDDQATRLAAQRTQVPNIVQLALFGIGFVASGFAGYATGLNARRSRFPVYVMSLLVASVIILILDLDRPGAGYIMVSQQPMIDAAASIAAFSE